jgi:hypothetical protein
MRGFAFKLCHDGIVDVERGLHTETHIMIWEYGQGGPSIRIE